MRCRIMSAETWHLMSPSDPAVNSNSGGTPPTTPYSGTSVATTASESNACRCLSGYNRPPWHLHSGTRACRRSGCHYAGHDWPDPAWAVGNVDVATDHRIAVHVDAAEPVGEQAGPISMHYKIANPNLYRLRSSSSDSGYRPNAMAGFVRNQPQTRIRAGFL